MDVLQVVGYLAELTLYELHRKPHEMVSDNSTIAVSPRSLHSELMCPICLDLMRNTQTTKEVSCYARKYPYSEIPME